MSSVNWTRWSGLAAMAAGALMLAGVLQDAGLDPEHRVPHKVPYLMPVIPMLFLAAVAGLLSGLTLVFGRLAPWAPTAILALYAGAWIALGYVLWSDSRGLSAVGDFGD